MSTPPTKTIPSITGLPKPHVSHTDYRGGGYHWAKEYPSLGFGIYEGKKTRYAQPYRWYAFLDDYATEYLTPNEFLAAYWKRNPEAYLLACEAQGVTPDPAITAQEASW